MIPTITFEGIIWIVLWSFGIGFCAGMVFLLWAISKKR